MAALAPAVLAAAVAASPAPAKPRGAPPKGATAPAPPPLAPLPMLPSVARVAITRLGKTLVVSQDVNLPRGEWRGEPLAFHVAFGAPGVPRAIDAHLVAVEDGSLEAPEDAPGEPLPTERVPRRPRSAHPLLGREQMAGIVVHLRAEALGRALAPGRMATLRVRSVVDAGEVDPDGAQGVVIRLGASRGTPLTLGRVTVGAKAPAPPVARAEARLCGPDADPHELAVAVSPRPEEPPPSPRIAPVLAVRHASDDLCVRIW